MRATVVIPISIDNKSQVDKKIMYDKGIITALNKLFPDKNFVSALTILNNNLTYHNDNIYQEIKRELRFTEIRDFLDNTKGINIYVDHIEIDYYGLLIIMEEYIDDND